MDDPNPYRRNLVVTSMAFIAYNIGGGEIEGDTISISAVSIRFTKPEMIVVLAWVTFFWFAYRFFLSHKQGYFRYVINESKNLGGRPYLIKRLERAKQTVREPEIKDPSLWGPVKVGSVPHIFHDGVLGGRASYNHQNVNLEYPLQGLERKYIRARVFLETCIFQTGFSDFIAPWLLAISAVLTAVANWAC